MAVRNLSGRSQASRHPLRTAQSPMVNPASGSSKRSQPRPPSAKLGRSTSSRRSRSETAAHSRRDLSDPRMGKQGTLMTPHSTRPLASTPIPQGSPLDRPRSLKRSRRYSKRRTPPGQHLLRAVVFGISLAIVVGGLSQLLRSDSAPAETAPVATMIPTAAPGQPLLNLTNEIEDLQQTLATLSDQPGLAAGAVFVDVDSGRYVALNPDERISAASVIKLPILVAFFQAVDRGEVRLNETLTLKQELLGGGSGTLQSLPLGTEVSALEAATLMITISDNTATNLVIERLGGKEELNEVFLEWGLTHTQISWFLPDLEGTNTTSPLDIATVLNQIEQGKLVSRRSRDRILDIMSRTQNRVLLPEGLGEEARIAHKTGNIRSVVGDVGIVDVPNGLRYLAVILVKRETPNDPAAVELIQEISSKVYDYWLKLAPGGLQAAPAPLSEDEAVRSDDE